MSAIVLNTKYVELISNNNYSSPVKGFKGSFNIISTLKEIGIQENNEVVIALPNKDDLSFFSAGSITKVGTVDKLQVPISTHTNKPTKDKYLHNFSINIKHDLNGNNLLSDLEYSIKAVYRFNKPIIHFQQQFRDLTTNDYETIVKGWVYSSRTAFGKLINSIPRQNKLEFMLQAMDKFSTVDFKNVPLYDGLDFLYKYIDKRILSRGKLLVETNSLIKHHLSNIIPYDEVGFFNPTNTKSDKISIQAALFEKLFRLEKDSDMRKLINQSISEDSFLEERFLQIFKMETWPIDLTV